MPGSSAASRGAPHCAALLAVLLVLRMVRLVRARAAGLPGARLQLKLASALVVLALPPLILLYGFALRFIGSSIDSWFNVRIDTALSDAGTMGRLYIDEQLADRSRDSQALAATLAALPAADPRAALPAALDRGARRRVS